VTLTHSAVVSNTTNNWGGGIYTNQSGSLTLINSAVLSNTAGDSGGGLFVDTGALTLTNTTVSGNAAADNGGGLYPRTDVTMQLSNATLTKNTADSDADGAGNGGGLYRSGANAPARFRNTLIAGNADNSPTTKHPDCSGTFTSQGYNLVGNDTGCTFTTQTGDQRGTSGSPIDPKLGALANNGGPTLTHALLSGTLCVYDGLDIAHL
jgi:hypothetical protein